MEIKTKKCIKCGSTEAVKNGMVGGWQRYKCKTCGYQYTKQSLQGQSIFIRILSSGLFLLGLSKREIARIVGVTPMTIVRWIKKYHIFYLTSIAPVEERQIMRKREVKKLIDESSSDEIMVITRKLPSGGRMDVLVHQPVKNKNH